MFPTDAPSDAPSAPAAASTPHIVATDATATPDLATQTAPLVEVGFWADPRDERDERPHPAQLVDEDWGKTAAALAVALYARCGFLESYELGYSFCRLGCFGGGGSGGGGGGGGGGGPESRGRAERSNRLMGCTTLTDGEYVWPEGLAHYVSEHSVRPPEAFVRRSLSNLRSLRGAQQGGRLRWDVDAGGRGRTAPLDPGTAVFLRDRTTLGLALPPEPEISPRSPRGGGRRSGRSEEAGVCSCKAS